MKTKRCLLLLAGLPLTLMLGCVSRPPTIAHVHIGHALTGVHVTPDKEGYLVTAERKATQASDLAKAAAAANDLSLIKTDIAGVVEATHSDDSFGVKHALTMAAHHVSFAATSDDASANLQKSAPTFANDIGRVIERCELIALLGKDVASSTDIKEARVSADEIVKLTDANINGDDSNGDGTVGGIPSEFGLVQLRKELEGVVARENPPYVTVDRWYLFNLVRLPNGRWVYDKLGRGGSIEGYK